MKNNWQKVVFAHDCIFEDWDTEKESPICPICKTDYSECPCPGPTMDEFKYKTVKGTMYAKKKETRGGTRIGAGRKPKYKEATTTVAFRVPVSLVPKVKAAVAKLIAAAAVPSSPGNHPPSS